MRANRLGVVLTLATATLAAPCVAANTANSATTGSTESMGLRGWGPRVGVGSDPDQAIAGVQFDVGQFAPRVHFVPNIELGFGDDHTIVAVTAPVLYRWDKGKASVQPFAGGGLTVGWIDHDHPDRRSDDAGSDVEVALEGIGGVTWNLRDRTDFSVEMNLVFGDLWDLKFLAGWIFRR
jgi:hypothetical protein